MATHPCHPAHPHPPMPRRAFTLVELVLAAALAAIVFVGLQSAIVIAAKAVPGASIASQSIAQSRFLDRLELDLSYAKTISTPTASSVVLTVQDRDGDAVDDTVTYAWSGVSGDPVTRAFNSSADETMLADTRSVTLSVKSASTTPATTYTESAESILASWTGSSSLGADNVDSSHAVGQIISVSLPAGATAYRVTRLALVAQSSAVANGEARLQIANVRSGLPGTHVFTSTQVLESSLPNSFAWVTFSFASPPTLDATEDVAAVVRFVATNIAGQFQYQGSGASASAGTIVESSDAGLSWTATSGKALRYQLYGVALTPASSAATTYASSITVSVQSGSAEPLELTLPLPAHPTILP